MGTVATDALIDRASLLLHDEARDRWGRGELLGWLNDAQRAAVNLVATAYTKQVDHSLVGGTRQALPADAVRLLNIPRNVGGRAVRYVDRALLDTENPDWHTATADATARMYTYDPTRPQEFFISPPQPGVSPGAVELEYSATPPNVSIGEPIALDDIYAEALLDYVMYRALSKDAETSTDEMARASAHYRAFAVALGAKVDADGSVVPPKP